MPKLFAQIFATSLAVTIATPAFAAEANLEQLLKLIEQPATFALDVGSDLGGPVVDVSPGQLDSLAELLAKKGNKYQTERVIDEIMPRVAAKLESDPAKRGVLVLLNVQDSATDAVGDVTNVVVSDPAHNPRDAMVGIFKTELTEGSLHAADGRLSDANSGYIWFERGSNGHLEGQPYTGGYAMAARDAAYATAMELVQNPEFASQSILDAIGSSEPKTLLESLQVRLPGDQAKADEPAVPLRPAAEESKHQDTPASKSNAEPAKKDGEGDPGTQPTVPGAETPANPDTSDDPERPAPSDQETTDTTDDEEPTDTTDDEDVEETPSDTGAIDDTADDGDTVDFDTDEGFQIQTWDEGSPVLAAAVENAVKAGNYEALAMYSHYLIWQQQHPHLNPLASDSAVNALLKGELFDAYGSKAIAQWGGILGGLQQAGVTVKPPTHF